MQWNGSGNAAKFQRKRSDEAVKMALKKQWKGSGNAPKGRRKGSEIAVENVPPSTSAAVARSQPGTTSGPATSHRVEGSCVTRIYDCSTPAHAKHRRVQSNEAGMLICRIAERRKEEKMRSERGEGSGAERRERGEERGERREERGERREVCMLLRRVYC